MSDRTIRLTTPHMHGNDVTLLQRDINAELKRWKVPHTITVDGDYGQGTRDALESVLYGLGIAQAEVAHGVTPAVRLKVRNRKLTADEHKRYDERAGWRVRLAKRYAGSGADLAIAYAIEHIGTMENPPGSNRGPLIDQWTRAVGITPGPYAYWCGAFANACLVAAGFKPMTFMAYCPYIEAHAKGGIDGWKWHGPLSSPKPGWLALFTEGGIAGHVELVVDVDGKLPIDVGGNTSKQGSTSSMSNGGGVFRHTDRRPSGGFPIRGYAEPPYHLV